MTGRVRTCHLTIGDAAFAFDSPPGRTLPDLYAPFASPAPEVLGGAHYAVVSTPPPCGPTDHTFWAGPSWQLVRRGARVAIDVCDPFSRQWRCAADTDPEFKRGFLFPWQADGAILGPPADRVLMVNRLAREGVAVLHASAVRVDGGVYLFCGRSGIGKSTMADLWLAHGRGELLNDDRAIVFCGNEGAMGGAAPWHGKHPHVDPTPGPLRGIFHLAQSPENRLSPVRDGDAVAKLLATSVVPFYYQPGVAGVADALANVCETVPSFDLAFCPGPEVLELLETRL